MHPNKGRSSAQETAPLTTHFTVKIAWSLMLTRFLAFCALTAAETCLNGTECEEVNLLSYAAEEEGGFS